MLSQLSMNAYWMILCKCSNLEIFCRGIYYLENTEVQVECNATDHMHTKNRILELNITSILFSDDDLAATISCFPQLATLNLSDCKCISLTVVDFATLDNLVFVRLKNSAATPDGITNILTSTDCYFVCIEGLQFLHKRASIEQFVLGPLVADMPLMLCGLKEAVYEQSPDKGYNHTYTGYLYYTKHSPCYVCRLICSGISNLQCVHLSLKKIDHSYNMNTDFFGL